MEEIPIITDKGETIEITNYNPIRIKQNEILYELNIKSKENNITLTINSKERFPSVNFSRKMNFKEIKELNKIFSLLGSINDFYDYLKLLSDNKKLNIKKWNDKISIIIYAEALLKQQEIIIDLFPTKKSTDSRVDDIDRELLDLSKEIDILKKENRKLNGEIETIKAENKELRKTIEEQNIKINNLEIVFKKNMKSLTEEIKTDESIIMKEDVERKLIFIEIEKRMNKKIKEIKKLYQASFDGGDSVNFHNKCDNIPNTLVLIKSEGQRRFGGFTPIPWKSEGGYMKDRNMITFVFSLDNKKVYNLFSIMGFPSMAISLPSPKQGPEFLS